jgi:hypothetical protein
MHAVARTMQELGIVRRSRGHQGLLAGVVHWEALPSGASGQRVEPQGALHGWVDLLRQVSELWCCEKALQGLPPRVAGPSY